ncbi:hypothetical protein HanIR_Chr13g0658861 [Helianthus annuus]|nr:hypothetical protein HanIR_Chr13g0658861 [Helianthus annuus]
MRIGDTNNRGPFASKMIKIQQMLSPHHSGTDDPILHHLLSHFLFQIFIIHTQSHPNCVKI